MKKRMIAGLLALVMALALLPGAAFAANTSAKTVKMTAYNEVYKSGNTAYCCGIQVYKVKLKNGRVKSVKRISKNTGYAMKKNGGYLYYLGGPPSGYVESIYRIKFSSGKKKKLLTLECIDYAIKGKKIYYRGYRNDGAKSVKGEMNLNGTKKKKTSVKAVLKRKSSNTKGYSVITKYGDEYAKDYLKTPKGTYYLGKASSDW